MVINNKEFIQHIEELGKILEMEIKNLTLETHNRPDTENLQIKWENWKKETINLAKTFVK
jgi:hypothetical protein